MPLSEVKEHLKDQSVSFSTWSRRVPHRALRIEQCRNSEFTEVNVTELGVALLIHNQLSHVSLPGLDEFSPGIDQPLTAAPKGEHSEKDCHCPAMVLQLPLPVCQRRCPGELRCLLGPKECSATSVGGESGAQDGWEPVSTISRLLP